MKEYSIGVDIGTTGGKAALYKGTRQIASFRLDYPTYSESVGFAEHDAEDWYICACAGIKAVLNESGVSPEDVSALGLSSMTPVLLPINKEGRPLMRAQLWCDTRCHGQLQKIHEIFEPETLLGITGSHIKTGQLLTKILQLKSDNPSVYEASAHFLQPTGYLTYRLTGEINTDASHGELTQLVELSTGEWSAQICDAFDIDIAKLPPLIPSDSIAGRLHEQAAKDCGLLTGTPVVSGGHDSALSAYALGVRQPYEGCLDIGNASNLVMCIPSPTHCQGSDLYRHPQRGIWLFQIYSGTTGAAFRWLKDQVCASAASRAESEGKNVYDEMCNMAARSPIGARGLLWTPYFAGAQQGGNVCSSLEGLTLAHKTDDLIRALLEGCALSIRWNLDDLEAAAGCPMQRLIMSGGGSKNSFWAQMHADILGRTIELSELSDTAVAGAAMLAHSVETGEAPQVVPSSCIYKPRNDSRDIYDALYRRFRKTMERQLRESKTQEECR